jgi:predicted aconitase
MYANSVLGARTLKYPNMLDCLVALTGRAPRAGLYLDENRAAVLRIKVTAIPEADDAYWPIMGYVVGAVAASRIPVITGLEDLKPSADDLKAFSAAFATIASAPMFHIVNITPEAPTVEATSYNGKRHKEEIPISKQIIRDHWSRLDQGSWPRRVDLVALGSPHFSVKEMMTLAGLCRGKTKHENTSVVVTCGRVQYSLAAQAGYVKELERFGVQFLADTCWCFIGEPIVAKPVEVIMTNSAKYRHYGPGLTGKQFCFGSLSMCVEAACSGRSNGELPMWLQQTDPN